MEGTSYNPEYDSHEDESKLHRKPKAETIGSLVVESKPEIESKKQASKEKLGQTLLDYELNKDRKETNFELDPILRHIDDATVSGGATHSTSLNGLLQKADQAIDSQTTNSAASSANPNPKSASAKINRRWIDIAMAGTILVLATLVIILIASRR